MYEFEQAVILINDKPINKTSGRQFSQYPDNTLILALHVLTAPALRLWLAIAGTMDGFKGSIKYYCQRANITSRNYDKYRKELKKKGFLDYTPYKTMEVLYPTEDTYDYDEEASPSESEGVIKKVSFSDRELEPLLEKIASQQEKEGSQGDVYNKEKDKHIKYMRQTYANKLDTLDSAAYGGTANTNGGVDDSKPCWTYKPYKMKFWWDEE